MTSMPSLQALLEFAGVQQPLFAPNSRYAGIARAELTTAAAGRIVYLRRRFIPQPGRLAEMRRHAVAPGERLDHIAARYFNDPELFWRICDANGALRPEELTARPGRSLRITLPEGVPGAKE